MKILEKFLKSPLIITLLLLMIVINSPPLVYAQKEIYDLNRDGRVGVGDIIQVLRKWGKYDSELKRTFNFGLILAILNNWGVVTKFTIGVAAIDKDYVDFYNQILEPNDFIAVRTGNIDWLDSFTAGKKHLVLTAHDYAQAESIINQAKIAGVENIAFNLEGKFTKNEMIQKEKEIYELVKLAGLTFTFAPTAFNLEKYYTDFVLYTDVIGFQIQSYQLRDDYQEAVFSLIDKMKQVNPDIKVFVQVSASPIDIETKQHVNLSSEELLEDIQEVYHKADYIFIFYSPKQWMVVKEVLESLRS